MTFYCLILSHQPPELPPSASVQSTATNTPQSIKFSTIGRYVQYVLINSCFASKSLLPEELQRLVEATLWSNYEGLEHIEHSVQWQRSCRSSWKSLTTCDVFFFCTQNIDFQQIHFFKKHFRTYSTLYFCSLNSFISFHSPSPPCGITSPSSVISFSPFSTSSSLNLSLHLSIPSSLEPFIHSPLNHSFIAHLSFAVSFLDQSFHSPAVITHFIHEVYAVSLAHSFLSLLSLSHYNFVFRSSRIRVTLLTEDNK